jgi:N-methylhydantoinase A
MGMIVTDVQHDYVASLYGTSSSLDLAAVNEVFAGLESTARERLLGDGFDEERIEFRRAVDARYLAQIWEITVPIEVDPPFTEPDLATIAASFHDAHERQFTYALREQEVEFLHWRLTAVGKAPAWREAEADSADGAPVEPIGGREAYFPEENGMVVTPVHRVERLHAGAQVSGPAIFESDTTTVVINPGDRLHVLGQGNLLVDVDVT